MADNRDVELALQEFAVEELENLDAPDWSSSFLVSLPASIAASTVAASIVLT